MPSGFGRTLALVLALAAHAGCSPSPDAGAPGEDGVGVDTAAAPVTTPVGDTGATETGERAEWDTDRARAIWADARARGASFRAIGQEPGWYLELFDGDSIVFVTDYGETRAVTPWPAQPGVEQTTGRVALSVRTVEHVLSVVLEQRPCTDAMSGQPFEFTVTVTLDGGAQDGCGRRLE